ncbi:MAG: PAS domain S-box protein [Fuerstiella sp.]
MIDAVLPTSLNVFRIPVNLFTLAVDTTLLSSIADLVAFAVLSAVSVLLVRLPEQRLRQGLVRCLSVLLCGCAVLHLVDFWSHRQSGSGWIIATGISTALLLVFAAAVLPMILRRRLAATDLQKTKESLEQAREQLSREQFLFTALMDNMPDCIYFKDRESRILRCNQTVADTFQLAAPTDVIGTCDHDFFTKEEADEYRADEVRIIETGEPVINKEEYELWPDGLHHWVLSTKLPLRNEHGDIIGTFGLSRDISALKRAEERMEAKVVELEQLDADFIREQRLFSALIENIPDAVYFKDRNCRFIRVNPAMATDAGFRTPDELIGLTDANIWGSDLPADAFADELRIMETGEPIVGKQEEVIRRTDNERRWVLTTKMPLRDADGSIVGTFGLARDITTLKVTQEWLSESQERFEFAVQGTTDGLWDWNIQTNEVWYAPRFRELLQLTSDSEDPFLNQLSSFTDRLHPDDRERVMTSFDEHLQHKKPHDEEYRLRLASGEYRWFRGRGQADRDESDQPIRMAGSIQDIDDQHQVRNELARMRLQLQQALEGGHVGMWDWNIATDEITVSPELMLQIGEDPDKPWTSLEDWKRHLHPDDIDNATQKTWDYIGGRTEEYESSFRLRHADGAYLWILSRGKLFRDDNGDPGRFIGVHIDVTELRDAEEALARSEAKFRGIFNQTFQFIGLMTPDGKLIDANQAFLAAAGIKSEDVLNRQFRDTVWWSHSPELQKRLQQAVEKARGGEFDRFEATLPTPDGASIVVDFSLKPITNEEGDVVFLIPEGRDVTEIKKFEQQLQARSDELEQSNQELQQFAYVASHDLQEPLRTIVGFCQLLEMEYSELLNDDGKMYLETIVDGGKRMQRLISDLLEYSRVGRMGNPREHTPLRQPVDEALALLHARIQESGAIITIEALPDAWIDHVQMIRVFQNLIGNAIKYRGEKVPEVRIWSQESSDAWKIYVSDNGIGISEEFSDQVFIIFKRLHTRDEHPGTGIGLAICRRIVERHGGSIRLVSDRNEGSTFEFTLPKRPPA